MGSPYRFIESLRHKPALDISSVEIEAFSVIAKSLAHPERSLLNTFIENSVNPKSASIFFLDRTSGPNSVAVDEFLSDWICLLHRVRAIPCELRDEKFRNNVWQRDNGQCCISKARGGKPDDGSLLLVHILPPSLLHDIDLPEQRRLYELFSVYLGEKQVQDLRSLRERDFSHSDRDRSNEVMLLSPEMYEHFRNGTVSLRSSGVATDDVVPLYLEVNCSIPFVDIQRDQDAILVNRAACPASCPSTLLLEVHNRFSDALSWMEVMKFMKQNSDQSKTRSNSDRYPEAKVHILRNIWVRLPKWFRAMTYRWLASISLRFYGYTGSDRTYRLPCGLYLRMASRDWAPKLEAEFQSLHVVEQHTQIPAPIGLDAMKDSQHSFLLMTSCAGKPIGKMLSIMSDAQLSTVVQDLKLYVAQLRQIATQVDSEYQICNASGGGILDWRIGDSQREELRFRDENMFNRYLTFDLPLDERTRAMISRSHGKAHQIVFTHSDLNMRNILVDKAGKISGIVDWECSGWYPEYWEYSKAHFTARVTSRWIADVIDQVFNGYHDELEAENLLQSMSPPW